MTQSFQSLRAEIQEIKVTNFVSPTWNRNEWMNIRTFMRSQPKNDHLPCLQNWPLISVSDPWALEKHSKKMLISFGEVCTFLQSPTCQLQFFTDIYVRTNYSVHIPISSCQEIMDSLEGLFFLITPSCSRIERNTIRLVIPVCTFLQSPTCQLQFFTDIYVRTNYSVHIPISSCQEIMDSLEGLFFLITPSCSRIERNTIRLVISLWLNTGVSYIIKVYWWLAFSFHAINTKKEGIE